MTNQAKDRCPVEVVSATETCVHGCYIRMKITDGCAAARTLFVFRRTVRLGLSRMLEAGGVASSVGISVRGIIMIV